jgi:hypothetical protein
MSEPNILYPAIFVFSMLLIGLLLTMWEFTRLFKRRQEKVENNKRFTGLDSQVYRENVRNV